MGFWKRQRGRKIARGLQGRTWIDNLKEGTPYLAWAGGSTAGILLIAWLVGLASGFGEDTDTAYFAATAGLVPVLLVAFLIEGATVFGYVRGLPKYAESKGREYLKPQFEGFTRQVKAQLLTIFPLALVGEATALISLGKQASSTFLVLASALSSLGIFALLARTYWRRL